MPRPVMPQFRPERCDEFVARSPSRTVQALLQGDLHHVSELGRVMSEGGEHLIEVTSVQPSSVANMITGRISQIWLPTNVGLRVAELGRRRTRVPESGGCSGLSKDVMFAANHTGVQ